MAAGSVRVCTLLVTARLHAASVTQHVLRDCDGREHGMKNNDNARVVVVERDLDDDRLVVERDPDDDRLVHDECFLVRRCRSVFHGGASLPR